MRLVDLIKDLDLSYKRQNMKREQILLISTAALFEIEADVEMSKMIGYPSGEARTIMGMKYSLVYANNEISLSLVDLELYNSLIKSIYTETQQAVGRSIEQQFIIRKK